MPKKRYALDEREIIQNHFRHLLRCVRDEEKLERNSFDSDRLNKTPDQRQKQGRSLLFLGLYEIRYNPSGQKLLTFTLLNKRPIPHGSLRAGDVVELSGLDAKGRNRERITGTVFERDKQSITVAFSHHLPGWVSSQKAYHLDLARNQSTYERMYQALHTLSEAKHTKASYLRDISLGLKKPRFLDPVKIEDISFFDKQLNQKQKEAVCRTFSNEDLMIIHGPPGTGKTSVLVELIRQIRKQDQTILVSTPSNAACDHLVASLVEKEVGVTRLGHPARMIPALRDHTLSYQIARHKYAKLIHQNETRLEQLFKQKDRKQDRRALTREAKDALFEEVRALKEENRSLRTAIFQQIWRASDVVVTTHAVAADPLIKEKSFDWIILDEATQAIEPASWIPVLHAGRLVLAGDHCQLPPTVRSFKRSSRDLSHTLFERLLEKLPESCKIQLETQYRMHEKIMRFSSEQFYEGQLKSASAVKNRRLCDLEGIQKNELTSTPVTFLDTAGLGYEEKTAEGSSSRFNEEEARLVIRQYKAVTKAGLEASQIGIISPYSAQVKLIHSLIYQDEWDAEHGRGPEIASVDAFQGREKECMIVSLVRSNLKGEIGFLGDTRRMNVALTRAKRKLIVIGDSATIASLPFYQNFLDFIESIQAYASAWEYA